MFVQVEHLRQHFSNKGLTLDAGHLKQLTLTHRQPRKQLGNQPLNPCRHALPINLPFDPVPCGVFDNFTAGLHPT